MLANFLEKSKPINFTIYLSFFLILFLAHTFLNFYFNNLNANYLLNRFGIFTLFLGLFFAYNFIVRKNRLTFDNTYAFFILILETILFLDEINNLKLFISVFTYLLLLRRLHSLQTTTNVLQKLFDSGLWLGVLFIINPASIVFIVLIITATYLHQKTTVNTLITPIVGFLCPLVIYYTYLLYFDNRSNSIFNFESIYQLTSSKNNFDYRVLTIIIISFIGFILKSPKALSISNSFKKSWILIATNAILAVLFYYYESYNNGSEIVIFLIPFSIIAGNGLEVIKKSFYKDLLLGVFITATLTYFFLN